MLQQHLLIDVLLEASAQTLQEVLELEVFCSVLFKVWKTPAQGCLERLKPAACSSSTIVIHDIYASGCCLRVLPEGGQFNVIRMQG